MGSALNNLDPETLRKLAAAAGQQQNTIPVPNDFGAGGLVPMPLAQVSQQPVPSMRPVGQMGPAPPVTPRDLYQEPKSAPAAASVPMTPDPDALMPMTPDPAAAARGPATAPSAKLGMTGTDRGKLIAQFLRQQRGQDQGTGFESTLADLVRRRGGRGGY